MQKFDWKKRRQLMVSCIYKEEKHSEKIGNTIAHSTRISIRKKASKLFVHRSMIYGKKRQ